MENEKRIVTYRDKWSSLAEQLAVFHMFTVAGSAIIELKTGDVLCVQLCDIQFKKPIFDEILTSEKMLNEYKTV